MVLIPYDKFTMTTEKSPQIFKTALLRLTKGEDAEYKLGKKPTGENEAVLLPQLTAEGFNPVLSLKFSEVGDKTKVAAELKFSKLAYIVMAVLFAALLILVAIGAVVLAKTGDAAVVSVPIILMIFFYALACLLFALAKRRILNDLNEII